MDRYQQSTDWLVKAEHLIPTGSQTFSKSYFCLPKGAAPLFLQAGKGATVTDVDGHSYTDLINGLLSISLGYAYPAVDAAIIKQLKQGINFSLPHTLEALLAEQLVALIPCAEQVRFGKNGSDMTAAGARLARAYTGREHIAVCGYHGWQDWYIGSTSRNKGVPAAVQQLTHHFQFNDIASLERLFHQYPDQIALVMLEQMNVTAPQPGFLTAVRKLCDRHGAVLMFDEVITGFRFDLGGAQSLFGVTPDLATFGKGMGNGMPIAALVGKKALMQEMEHIFISGTFSGEALSLAASLAVIETMAQQKTPQYLASIGDYLTNKVQAAAQETGAKQWFQLVGHPSWKIWQLQDQDMIYKSVLIQLLAERNVLTIGSHNISASLNESLADKVALAYYEAFEIIQSSSHPAQLLAGEPLRPIFKVR